MAQLGLPERVRSLFAKYKYGILIVAAGMFLMLLPSSEPKTPENPELQQTQPTVTVQHELESILSQIQGVGKVRVMISEATGEETVFQTDTELDVDETNRSEQRKTVVVSSSGEEKGLIRTVTPPTYLGAIVVCEGGDVPTVQLAVAQAVAAVTGISSDRIRVLKMK